MVKKTTYNINMVDGRTLEVSGTVINGIWGIDKRLVTTKETKMKDGNPMPVSFSYYCLTHIPTGCFVTSADRMTTLKEIATLPELSGVQDIEKEAKGIRIAIYKYWNERWWRG